MPDLAPRLDKIIEQDRRYKLDAYDFVLAALSYTQKKIKKGGHVSGQELLLGIKEYALEQFGGLSAIVFEHWGIKKTEDFGEIVFNMVGENILHRTANDTKKDFKNGYKFEEVFRATYDIESR
ncbi:MAG: hypothetical protein COV72_07960 [Candidatus Omnitrophica bacterium CG11_big_fil_rev_8_21_14_0_20_42_13]|uniref:Uncharacterized protein n=1 Tax=Candidatus Ghiorseimicrobium undicola TaxID=1974746 RepID=A0A2H0LVY0_9BACT|nr:MAG: hypothetical protein COV72_07960 [Candidatus Omnitrophica bacterium CG11_big_fil_rev_8_21_14_0_20_42_13]